MTGLYFFTRCSTCGFTVQVTGRPEILKHMFDTPEWAINFPCVRPGCQGRALRKELHEVHSSIQAYDFQEVPPETYFRALLGFGGLLCSPAGAGEVVNLLLTRRIVSVKAYPIGEPERTILQEITFEDGTKLHLEASDRGACAYLIEKDGFHGQERRDPRAAPSILASHGAEAGPPLGTEQCPGTDVEADALDGGHLPGVPEESHIPEGGLPGGRADHDQILRL